MWWHDLVDPYWCGAAWTAVGEARRTLGSGEAMQAFEEALRCWRAAGVQPEEADALATLGTILQGTGVEDALHRFEESLAVARALSDPVREARALNGVGESRALLGQMQEAFDAFSEILALQRRRSDVAGEVEALGNLGYVYLQLGDYVEAADLFRRALEAERRSGGHSFEATLLNNLGQALLQQEDFDGARKQFEAALSLRTEGDPRRAYALVNLGGVYRASGDARRALSLFETALESFRATGNRPAEATTLDNLGWAQAILGDPDRAVELHMQAMALREASGDTVNQIPSLYLAAKAELLRGRPDEARRLSERAVELVEAQRDRVLSKRLRTSLLAPVRVVYEGYVDALMALHRGQPDAGFDRLAFDVSERARARSLLELVGDAGGPLGEKPPGCCAQPLTLAELRGRVLDDETVVVAYLLGDDHSHVWAWTGETLVAHELPPRAELAKLARQSNELLAKRPGRRSSTGGPETDGIPDVLAKLSQALLAPVAAQLGARRIVVVADGPLHYVPFAALPAPDTPGVPLLVEHEVVTLPSVSTLALLRETARTQVPPSKGVAVFADPVFDAQDERVRPLRRAGAASRSAAAPGPPGPARPSRLSSSVRDVDGSASGVLGRLPFTRQEALAILALAGPQESRGALGFDASLEAVRDPDLAEFRFVHFATHGLLNNARPELSGLVLTLSGPDGRPREGFLSVDEILKLRWRAELVTLSGCRTGLGRSVRGEGLVGVTRAFMVAGAQRVVASLWSVDDSATAELMKRFYEEMLGPAKRSPAAALRSAQLALREKRAWASPYYWAAFQLYGDWR
jgi:CHAT domain-containing protein/tetratricopeptide (TPR) repeat protein